MRIQLTANMTIILTRMCTLIYPLLFFCGSLLSLVSIAHAQPCTPVVYVFRHAEDFKAVSQLTPAGEAHANLYPSMLEDFGRLHGYCPVGYVYAQYRIKPAGNPGTNNPYATAVPLASYACQQLADFKALFNQPYDCNGQNVDPRETLQDYPDEFLYEYLGESEAEKPTKNGTKYPKGGQSLTGDELRQQLVLNSQQFQNLYGVSSAIFWTSQGMNILGQAIVPGFTEIPGCKEPPFDAPCQDNKPGRNVVYVFEFRGNGAPVATAFSPPANLTQYLQCFNVKDLKLLQDGKYYCSRDGSSLVEKVDGKPLNDPTHPPNHPLDADHLKAIPLQGKICDTANLAADCVPPDYN
jgi:hypothetical protein